MGEQRNDGTDPPHPWRKPGSFRDEPFPASLPLKGARGKRAPRWTVAFLRALERTGEVEAAARDAGIDKSTAYSRRKAHSNFAEAWEDALRLRSGRTEAEVKERVGFWERLKGKVTPKVLSRQDRSTISSSAHPHARPSPGWSARGDPPPRARLRGELNASTSLGGKIVRAGPGRWNAAAEQRFFDELAATANVRRACAAAGVSTNAVYARRMKRPEFRAKWDAVLETGRAAIEMHLVETAKKAFDPDELDVGDIQPKVSVAEAIRIVQLHGSKAQRQSVEQIEPPEAEVEAVRERLLNKLERLRKREMPAMLAQGWSYDEEHDHMVPPGWVRGPDEAGADAVSDE